MEVHALYRYPVKSLPGIAVSELELDSFGPSQDRRWMLVDQGGRFVSQRVHPRLARVTVSMDGDCPVVTLPGQASLRLEPGEEFTQVQVWRDSVEAVLAADERIHEAFSDFLATRVSMVFMPESTRRAIDPEYSSRGRVSFADGFPFLVASTASLDDLSARYGQPIDMRRFRPNVVLSGGQAWQEDHWVELAIGGTTLSLVKPCTRCVLITVDPATGSLDPNREPLRTLASYRKTAAGVVFGMNAIHIAGQRLAIGEDVVVRQTSDISKTA